MDIDPNWLGFPGVSIGIPREHLTTMYSEFRGEVFKNLWYQEPIILTADFFPEGDSRLNFKKLTRFLGFQEGSKEYDRLAGIMHTCDVIRFHEEVIDEQ
jgi:hypothetical protein